MQGRPAVVNHDITEVVDEISGVEIDPARQFLLNGNMEVTNCLHCTQARTSFFSGSGKELRRSIPPVCAIDSIMRTPGIIGCPGKQQQYK